MYSKKRTEIPTGNKNKMSTSRDALEDMYQIVNPLHYHLPTESTQSP